MCLWIRKENHKRGNNVSAAGAFYKYVCTNNHVFYKRRLLSWYFFKGSFLKHGFFTCLNLIQVQLSFSRGGLKRVNPTMTTSTVTARRPGEKETLNIIGNKELKNKKINYIFIYMYVYIHTTKKYNRYNRDKYPFARIMMQQTSQAIDK